MDEKKLLEILNSVFYDEIKDKFNESRMTWEECQESVFEDVFLHIKQKINPKD